MEPLLLPLGKWWMAIEAKQTGKVVYNRGNCHLGRGTESGRNFF